VQAVYGFTQGGAECLGFDWPEKLGSIEVGKLANFIVVDQNIFEIPINEVKATKFYITVVGGDAVFE
jgi:predicted amidohydrolase YtcJ